MIDVYEMRDKKSSIFIFFKVHNSSEVEDRTFDQKIHTSEACFGLLCSLSIV